MNVLWITNVLFPEAESIIKKTSIDHKSSGGWLIAMADSLVKATNIKLTVATVSHLVKELKFIEGEKIKYIVLPYGRGNYKYNSEYEVYWNSIEKRIHPDVVHIHGTEFTHGLAYVRACGYENVVVSIQGLVSEISKHYMADIGFIDFLRTLTIKDIVTGHNMLALKKMYRIRGIYEIELLKKVRYVCGRTTWDKACSFNINKYIKYNYCGEIIRKEFYEGVWCYNECKKHSIFLSQSHYPLKGLHKVLEAVSFVKNVYPDVHVNIAGSNITCYNSIKDKVKISGYGIYIRKLIKKFNLVKNVTFLGHLNAEEMKKQYLSCNVFVCSSSLENSPNSIAEAQLLGVPVIGSYVGGIPDLIDNKKMGILYPFDDINLLSFSICRVFNNEMDIDIEYMQQRARARHCESTIRQQVLDVYKLICPKK